MSWEQLVRFSLFYCSPNPRTLENITSDTLFTARRDWASRSLRRESEEVIVVEVLIEEMFRSGRNRPRDYETSRGRRADHPKQTRPLGGVNGEVCSKKI